ETQGKVLAIRWLLAASRKRSGRNMAFKLSSELVDVAKGSGQIGYVIIGIIVGDSNGGYASMITYMLFYISMNIGTFDCIVLFGLRTGTDNIRDYAGLYTKDPFLALYLALFLLSLEEWVEGVGFVGREEVLNWGLSGPMLRASGIQWDLREVDNYECYEELDW
ncbi:hypothetical protein RYX36_032257, partial [Vicia faba]